MLSNKPETCLYASISSRKHIQSERAPWSLEILADRVFENDILIGLADLARKANEHYLQEFLGCDLTGFRS